MTSQSHILLCLLHILSTFSVRNTKPRLPLSQVAFYSSILENTFRRTKVMSESQESLSSQTGLSSQEGSYQTVKSDDGNYEFIVTERLRPFRPKDVNEHVAVYRGHYNGEDVIVKVSALS